MLTLMRRFARSWLSGALLLLVFIALGAFGWENYVAGGVGSNVVKAGPRSLTPEELRQKFEREVQRSEERTGRYLNQLEALELGLLDQLVAFETVRTAYLGYIETLGAGASQSAVLEEIAAIEAFQDPVSGVFDAQRYQQILANNQLTPELFRQGVADDLSIEYLGQAAVGALKPPKALSTIAATLQGERREIAWFPITLEDVDPPADPDEAALRAFFDERASAFERPERRAISLLSFSPEDFKARIEISEEDLRAEYEALKSTRFAGPETRTWVQASFPDEPRALQAFGALAGGASPEEAFGAAAFETRSSVRDELSDEDLAAELFGLGARPGAVFGPYQRGQAYLVVQLSEITPGDPMPFDEVEDDVRAALAEERAEAAYADAVDNLPEYIGTGMSLSEIADELRTPLMSFAPVDARGVAEGGARFAALTRINGALADAFSLPVGRLGGPFQSEDTTHLIAVDEILEAETPTFESAREEVAKAYAAQAEQDALDAAAAAIVSAVEGGASFAEEAVARGETLRTPAAPLSRANLDPETPRSAIAAAFTNEVGAVAAAPGRAPDERLLVQVVSVTRPSGGELDALAAAAGGQLAGDLQRDIDAALQSEIRDVMEVEVNDRAVAAYAAQIRANQ